MSDALLIFPLFVASCAAFRLMLGSWLTAPAFCALYWTIFIGLNLLFPEYPILLPGLLYILAVLWMFAMSHLSVQAFSSDQTPRQLASDQRGASPTFLVDLKSSHYRWGLGITVVLGLAYVVLLQTGGVVIVDNISWWMQLLLLNQFSGPIAVGVLLGAGLVRGIDKWISMLVLLPALMTSILYTGRTAFFGPAVILATSYLSGTVLLKPQATPLFSWKRVIFISVAMVLSTLYGSAIYVLRVSRGEEDIRSISKKITVYSEAFDLETLSGSYDKIRSHLYGQPSSFTHMYRDTYDQASFRPMGGAFCFAGPLVLFGVERPSHQNYMTPDNVETNVYTVFAPAIEDFGIYGALAVWALLGFVSAFAYRASQRGKLVGAALLAMILMNLQNGSCFVFRYNSVIGSYILVTYCMYLLDRRRSLLPAFAPSVPTMPFHSLTHPKSGSIRSGLPRS